MLKGHLKRHFNKIRTIKLKKHHYVLGGFGIAVITILASIFGFQNIGTYAQDTQTPTSIICEWQGEKIMVESGSAGTIQLTCDTENLPILNLREIINIIPNENVISTGIITIEDESTLLPSNTTFNLNFTGINSGNIELTINGQLESGGEIYIISNENNNTGNIEVYYTQSPQTGPDCKVTATPENVTIGQGGTITVECSGENMIAQDLDFAIQTNEKINVEEYPSQTNIGDENITLEYQFTGAQAGTSYVLLQENIISANGTRNELITGNDIEVTDNTPIEPIECTIQASPDTVDVDETGKIIVTCETNSNLNDYLYSTDLEYEIDYISIEESALGTYTNGNYQYIFSYTGEDAIEQSILKLKEGVLSDGVSTNAEAEYTPGITVKAITPIEPIECTIQASPDTVDVDETGKIIVTCETNNNLNDYLYSTDLEYEIDYISIEERAPGIYTNGNYQYIFSYTGEDAIEQSILKLKEGVLSDGVSTNAEAEYTPGITVKAITPQSDPDFTVTAVPESVIKSQSVTPIEPIAGITISEYTTPDCLSGWNNDYFLTPDFWKMNPSTGNIVCALYGEGGSDQTAYTMGWKDYEPGVSCNEFTIEITGNLENNLSPNTIYVLTSTGFEINTQLDLPSCTAIISNQTGGKDTTITFANTTSGIIINGGYGIIDNISVRGKNNNEGISITTGSNTLNVVKVYNCEAGINVMGTYNLLNNIQSFSNNKGIYIESEKNAINNSQLYNNSIGLEVGEEATGNKVYNVEIYQNTTGLYVAGTNNEFEDIEAYGVEKYYSDEYKKNYVYIKSGTNNYATGKLQQYPIQQFIEVSGESQISGFDRVYSEGNGGGTYRMLQMPDGISPIYSGYKYPDYITNPQINDNDNTYLFNWSSNVSKPTQITTNIITRYSYGYEINTQKDVKLRDDNTGGLVTGNYFIGSNVQKYYIGGTLTDHTKLHYSLTGTNTDSNNMIKKYDILTILSPTITSTITGYYGPTWTKYHGYEITNTLTGITINSGVELFVGIGDSSNYPITVQMYGEDEEYFAEHRYVTPLTRSRPRLTIEPNTGKCVYEATINMTGTWKSYEYDITGFDYNNINVTENANFDTDTFNRSSTGVYTRQIQLTGGTGIINVLGNTAEDILEFTGYDRNTNYSYQYYRDIYGPNISTTGFSIYECTGINLDVTADDEGCAGISGYKLEGALGNTARQSGSGFQISTETIGRTGGTKTGLIYASDIFGNTREKIITGTIINIPPTLSTGTSKEDPYIYENTITGGSMTVVNVIDLLGATEGACGTGDLIVSAISCDEGLSGTTENNSITVTMDPGTGEKICAITIKDNEENSTVTGYIKFNAEYTVEKPNCTIDINPKMVYKGNTGLITITCTGENRGLLNTGNLDYNNDIITIDNPIKTTGTNTTTYTMEYTGTETGDSQFGINSGAISRGDVSNDYISGDNIYVIDPTNIPTCTITGTEIVILGQTGTITVTCYNEYGIQTTGLNSGNLVYESIIEVGDSTTIDGTGNQKEFTFTFTGITTGTTYLALKTGAISNVRKIENAYTSGNNITVTSNEDIVLHIDPQGSGWTNTGITVQMRGEHTTGLKYITGNDINNLDYDTCIGSGINLEDSTGTTNIEEEGITYLYLCGRSISGKTGYLTGIYQIDTTLPTFDLTGITELNECQTGTAEIINESEGLSGLPTHAYIWNGITGNSNTFSIYSGQVGSQTVSAKIIDNAGNISEEKTGTIIWQDIVLTITTGNIDLGTITGDVTRNNVIEDFNAEAGTCETITATVEGQNATCTLSGDQLTIKPIVNYNGTGSCTIEFTDGDTTKTGTYTFSINTITDELVLILNPEGSNDRTGNTVNVNMTAENASGAYYLLTGAIGVDFDTCRNSGTSLNQSGTETTFTGEITINSTGINYLYLCGKSLTGEQIIKSGVYKIDNTGPTGDVEYINGNGGTGNSCTTGTVTIKLVTGESVSGYPEEPFARNSTGTRTGVNTKTVSVNESGTGYIRDNAGHIIVLPYNVTGIVSERPTTPILNNPGSGETLASSNTEFSWTESQASGCATLNGYTMYIKSGDEIVRSGTTGGTSINPGDLSNGTYSRYVVAIDNFDQTAQSETQTFNVNTTAPIVSATNSSTSRKSGNINITMYATGINLSGSKYITGTSTNTFNQCRSSGSGYDSGYTLNRETEGIGYLTLCAYDQAGNTGYWTGIYKLDKTNPSCSISKSTSSRTSGNVILSVNVTETNPDKYSWTGWDNLVNTTGTWTMSSNGDKTFYVQDIAGNTGTCSTGVNNIDKTAPNGEIITTYPSGKLTNGCTSGSVTLTLSGTDTNGLHTTPYKRNNEAWTGNATITLTNNGQGTGYIRDVAGNITEISYNITGISVSGPDISLNTPHSGTILTGFVHFVWNRRTSNPTCQAISGGYNIVVYSGTDEVYTGKTNNTSIETSLSDGTYTWKVYAKDILGHTSTSQTRTLIINSQAPTCDIEYIPGSGAKTSGDVLAILTGCTLGATGFNATGHTFTGNTTYEFTFISELGITGNAIADVTRIDKDGPVLAEVTPIGTTTDTTPDYTFSSNESGTIAYSGACSSTKTGAISGNNTITLNQLSAGTYSGCTITVTDELGNVSNKLTISEFTIRSQGGGGGRTLRKDNCPDGDYSDSYYDGTCQGSHNSDRTRDICKVDESHYTDEIKLAYIYSYVYGMTTMCPISEAKIYGYLRRDHLAKILSQYAINVLDLEPEEGKSGCTAYNDIANESEEMKYYIKTACELGLMGLEANGDTPMKSFYPNGLVSRAEFGTTLSRLIYGDAYNLESEAENTHPGAWYEKHLEALRRDGIMTKIYGDRPQHNELRGYVMLMIMRHGKSRLDNVKDSDVNSSSEIIELYKKNKELTCEISYYESEDEYGSGMIYIKDNKLRENFNIYNKGSISSLIKNNKLYIRGNALGTGIGMVADAESTALEELESLLEDEIYTFKNCNEAVKNNNVFETPSNIRFKLIGDWFNELANSLGSRFE